MKIVINTDADSYVTDFYMVNDDYNGGYNIDIYQYDVNHINCYRFNGSILTLDETKLSKTLEKEEKEREKREKEREHEKKLNAQTLRLDEMFVAMGINVDDFLDRLDAQMLYTSLMTDTLLPEEDDEDVAENATTESEVEE